MTDSSPHQSPPEDAVTAIDLVRRFYNQQASENPRHAAVLGEPNDFATAYREHQEQATFLRNLVFKSSDCFLELGSGGGRWLELIANKVRFGVGVELSEQCVTVSRQRLADYPNISIVLSDITSYTPDRKFDYLYYSGVLLYLSDNQIHETLQRHLNALPDDCEVIMRDSLSTTQTHELCHPQGYRATYRTIEDWQTIMTAHGFELKSTSVANSYPLAAGVKHSSALLFGYRVARKVGLESPFIALVARLWGQSSSTDDTGYSHEFMFFRRVRGTAQEC